ncbi:MAG TPA: acetate/propionate family kinase [Azospirillum sp.]|nr:acetate/propionate family kinase [Azospirillum sp.]
MSGSILVLNAGSSSLKFTVFEAGALTLAFKGQISGIGSHPAFEAKAPGGDSLSGHHWDAANPPSAEELLSFLIDWISARVPDGIAAAGHRIVHGGDRFTAPVLIDPAVMGQLEDLVPLAPLHQPHNLRPIRALAALYPDLPQVACFDTAFHAGQPAVCRRFGLPRELHDRGVKRYGFHGLSYTYVAEALRDLDPAAAAGRVVVAHLGSGASLCAMQGGRSIESTMGFTALDGVMMGTRCGSLDAGVVLHLLRQGMDAAEVERMLYHKSGLLGVSGRSPDMRDLIGSDAPEAVEAVELFIHRVSRELGGQAATLGGLDALVFTAGIGEHSAPVRAKICERARWLGVELDPAANAARFSASRRISTPSSRIPVWVIPTDEEVVIARATVDAVRRTRLPLAAE